MVDDSENRDLTQRSSDYVARAARAALGGVPFVGSLLSELAGTIIPNQRIDRIVRFAEVLEEKLAALERDFVAAQLENENFGDLMEEGLRQVSRSLSDERREYIANLISRSLSAEEIEFHESKHLLRILGEVTDVEVIWLRAHSYSKDHQEFRERHNHVLGPVVPTTPEEQRRATLQKSYQEHLVRLGLLDSEYEVDSETNRPEFDDWKNAFEIRGYRLTDLGRLMLIELGLLESA